MTQDPRSIVLSRIRNKERINKWINIRAPGLVRLEVRVWRRVGDHVWRHVRDLVNWRIS